jgi:hypothetical protein
MKRILAITLLALSTAPAFAKDAQWPAAYMYQDQLAALLQSDVNTLNYVRGMGYLAGVSDNVNLSRAVNDLDACPDYSMGQVKTLFLAYALKHPETGQRDAAFAVTLSICDNK